VTPSLLQTTFPFGLFHVAFAASYYLASRQIVHLAADAPVGLLVKPERARKQLDDEIREEGATGGAGTGAGTTGGRTGAGTPGGGPGGDKGGTGGGPARSQPRRFHGTITLDAGRTGRDASKVAGEVLPHLVGLVGADVTVILEISARVPDGVPDNVVRIITENCRTLKSDDQGFEAE
jgi:hypothetical protein